MENLKELERQEKINHAVDEFDRLCTKGLVYGLSSTEIRKHKDILHKFIVQKKVFQERTAEIIHQKALHLDSLRAAFERRVAYEKKKEEINRDVAKERAKLIKVDKECIQYIVDQYDSFQEELEVPELKTESAKLYCKIFENAVVSAIEEFEIAGVNLI